jgi:hypothetical protein
MTGIPAHVSVNGLYYLAMSPPRRFLIAFMGCPILDPAGPTPDPGQGKGLPLQQALQPTLPKVSNSCTLLSATA